MMPGNPQGKHCARCVHMCVRGGGEGWRRGVGEGGGGERWGRGVEERGGGNGALG